MRIIEFMIAVTEKQLQDLGLQSRSYERVPIALDLDQIEAMYPNSDQETGEETTLVCMSSGTDYNVFASYQKVLTAWKTYNML